MLDEPLRVVLSYHTATDRELVSSLMTRLRADGLEADFLEHLDRASSPLRSLIEGRVRENWIDEFLRLLEGSIGCIQIASDPSTTSRLAQGGMWIEQQLSKQIADGNGDGFLRVVPGPSYTKPKSQAELDRYVEMAEDAAARTKGYTGQDVPLPDDLPSRVIDEERRSAGYASIRAKDWAEQTCAEIDDWLRGRAEIGPIRITRFESAKYNVPGHAGKYHDFEPADADLYPHKWCFVSPLGGAKRVWHCRRCLASSDPWDLERCLPPQSCPSCGDSGPNWERS